MASDRPTLEIAVVDTMVFAYALLGVTKHRDAAAAALERAGSIFVPDTFHSEIANVVAQWVRAEHLDLALGIGVLRDAAALITAVKPAEALSETALKLAVEHKHPAYDMMFVALAREIGAPLLSYDSKLKKLFPELVFTPDQFLEN